MSYSHLIHIDTPPKDQSSYTNSPSTTAAPECTDEQRKKVAHQLMFQDDEDFKNSATKNLYGLKARSENFQCPNPTWIKSFYEEEISTDTNDEDDDHHYFLGISVGCNKGHDAIRTARMGLSSTDFDAQKWATELDKGRTDDKMDSGVCKQASSDQAKIVSPKRAGEMHCIEPMPSTFSLLKRASDALRHENQGLVLTHAAISSAQGTAQFPSGEAAGREDIGIDFCNSSAERLPAQCEDVSVYSLEGYVAKYVKSKGPINILQIDVEGWDFDVLFGASSVLDRTHYLEFEYHVSGKWNKLHLPDAVRLLDGKGFTCYWAGKGQLWRITECYFEVYNHWHGWSNVACVHRSQKKLSEKMENLFLETLDAW